MSGPTPAGLVEAMAQAGYTAPAFIYRDRRNRFKVEGDHSGQRSGEIRRCKDGDGYTFGDYRTNKWGTWRNTDISTMTAEELAEYRRRCEEREYEADMERAERESKVAAEAEYLLGTLPPAPANYLYLVRKQIKPHGALVDGAGRLWLAVYTDDDGKPSSWQEISKDGTKNFARGGRVKDGYFPIGLLAPAYPDFAESAGISEDATIGICEGFATGASIHEATGYPVLVAFSAGNLKEVAVTTRRMFKKALIFIAADNDINSATNTGVIAATRAARAVDSFNNMVNGVLCVPDMRGVKGKDYSDLACALGPEEVKRQIERCLSEVSERDLARDIAREFDNTELGNARRMGAHFGEDIRFVEGKGWMLWRYGAWGFDESEAGALQLASRLPEIILSEINGDVDKAKQKVSWAYKSQSYKVILATIKLVESFEEIRCKADTIDADPMLVGVDGAKQIVELKTGTVRAATRSDYITMSLGVKSIGVASDATVWRAFLMASFPEDEELLEWVHKWCGYLLTGLVDEQCWVFCYGHGSNGKSVFFEVLHYVMGDYSRVIQTETLTASSRSAGAATPDLAALEGVRLITASETEGGSQLAEATIKQITGDGVLTVRELYKPLREIRIQCKLMMSGNHKPIIKGTDHGTWRRLNLLPFMRQFSPEEQDKKLPGKLRAEAEHIAAWLIEGCLKWQKEGLEPLPSVIRQASLEYREEQDIMGMWIEDCCCLAPGLWATSADLYQSPKEWAEAQGLRPLNNVTLGRKFTEKGIDAKKSRELGRYRQGIKLK